MSPATASIECPLVLLEGFLATTAFPKLVSFFGVSVADAVEGGGVVGKEV